MPGVVIQEVQIDGINSDPTTITLTVGANHLLIIGAWFYGEYGLLRNPPIEDNFGLSWNVSSIPGRYQSIYRAGPLNDNLISAFANTGGNVGSITISIGTNGHSASFKVIEVAGVNILDAYASSQAAGTGTATSGDFTTTQAGDFIIAFGFSLYPPGGIGTGSGYTSGGGILSAHYPTLFDLAGGLLCEYKTGGAAGVEQATFSVNTTGWMVVALAFTTSPPETGCIPVGDIVIDVCRKAGIAESLVDVSLLTSTNLKPTNICCGYLITRPTPAAQILQVLMQAYFFDIVESDGMLKCVPRGLPAVVTIPEDDLGLESDKAKFIETQAQEVDLSQRVTVLYNDEDIDYQQGKQEKARNARIISTRNQKIMTVPLTTKSDFARAVAEKALYLEWLERNGYAINLWRSKYMQYDPADVLQFLYEGLTFQIRVVDSTLGQGFVVAINGVGDNARNYLSSIRGGTSTGPQPTPGDVSAPTMLFLFDIPLLRDTDSNSAGTGFYYAMSSGISTWPGGVLYESSDNASFAVEDTDPLPASFGYATNVLGAPRSPWTWDYVNTLNVKMVRGTLASISELNVLNDKNALLYGNEVIQYQNAVLNLDGSYTLSKLLRGRRGTEWACATHGANELVLDPYTGLKHIADPLSVINQLLYYRGVTAGADPSAVASQDFTITGADLKPYAPVHIAGTRDGSGNLTLNWIRRTRIGGAWIDNVGTVPLSETSELYDVDVLSGGSVVRSLNDLTSPNVTYSAADQNTDFGSTPSALSVAVYQKSSTVGRGFAGKATV